MATLTFFHDFPAKVWGAYYTSVHIIFKFLRYLHFVSTANNEDLLFTQTTVVSPGNNGISVVVKCITVYITKQTLSIKTQQQMPCSSFPCHIN